MCFTARFNGLLGGLTLRLRTSLPLRTASSSRSFSDNEPFVGVVLPRRGRVGDADASARRRRAVSFVGSDVRPRGIVRNGGNTTRRGVTRMIKIKIENSVLGKTEQASSNAMRMCLYFVQY
jgi:hypothetical protein